MPQEQITIATKDGICPCHVLTSKAASKSPAVLFYMDAGGIRQVVVEMAQRLADAGYVVLLPDLFYRYGPYGPLLPRKLPESDLMALIGRLMATTDNAKAAADTAAFVEYLESRDDVIGKLGAVGFCMGGGMAIAAAATYPDHFAAVASFHGSDLATDDATSPHLMARRLKSEIYIAAAENDKFYPPAMADRFEAALSEAGVRFRAETYIGALHGWMKPDFPVFDEAASERGWTEMLALFDRSLHAT
jgi:carboxymethylenebutenolidase